MSGPRAGSCADSSPGAPDAILDVTADICPITWVKTKLALERLAQGQVLQVRLSEGQAMNDVPRSAKGDGHRVVAVHDMHDGSFAVSIQKGELR